MQHRIAFHQNARIQQLFQQQSSVNLWFMYYQADQHKIIDYLQTYGDNQHQIFPQHQFGFIKYQNIKSVHNLMNQSTMNNGNIELTTPCNNQLTMCYSKIDMNQLKQSHQNQDLQNIESNSIPLSGIQPLQCIVDGPLIKEMIEYANHCKPLNKYKQISLSQANIPSCLEILTNNGQYNQIDIHSLKADQSIQYVNVDHSLYDDCFDIVVLVNHAVLEFRSNEQQNTNDRLDYSMMMHRNVVYRVGGQVRFNMYYGVQSRLFDLVDGSPMFRKRRLLFVIKRRLEQS